MIAIPIVQRLARLMNLPCPTPNRDPINALLIAPADGVLAIIIGIDGPSYRPLGATMAILANGHRVGTLSSGCIESDIEHHAKTALDNGEPMRILYGHGSKYTDLALPCGGSLEILLVPRPDRQALEILDNNRIARKPCTLNIDPDTGDMHITDDGQTGANETHFSVRFEPDIFFYVFGKGPEACTFSALVQSAGYPNLLLSPDDETLDFAKSHGSPTQHLKQAVYPPDINPDQWSAILLFFHDHEWEPPILTAALKSDALYIGAQGSQRARDARHAEISALGATASDIARLKGPIGLILSARDARTLSVSVLAEVLQVAQQP